MAAGISILCYKSKMLANGAHPLMIRFCKDGKKRYMSLCGTGTLLFSRRTSYTAHRMRNGLGGRCFGVPARFIHDFRGVSWYA